MHIIHPTFRECWEEQISCIWNRNKHLCTKKLNEKSIRIVDLIKIPGIIKETELLCQWNNTIGVQYDCSEWSPKLNKYKEECSPPLFKNS